MRLTLIEPRVGLEDTYIAMVREFLANDEPLIPFPLEFEYEDFPAMVAKLTDQSIGVGLPDGFVANSTYWLLDEQEEIVAVSNLRHSLTPKLRHEGGHIGYGVRPSQRRKGYGNIVLRETLAKAWDLGLPKVLLTCAKQNAASNKVIVNNGGEFDSQAFSTQRNLIIHRYWICP